MRVLVEVEIATAKFELIFMVAGSEVRGHTTTDSRESGFEDDLGGATTKVKDCRGGGVFDGTNLAEEVVGCDPSINTWRVDIRFD